MYLVTGGAGFIGSNIVRRLLSRGEGKVRLLDNFSTGRWENIEGLEEVEVVEGSILDRDCLRQTMDGVEYVFHQGAIPSVPRSVADPLSSNEVNVTGTLMVLAEAKAAGVKRVVYAASSSAYGDTEVLPKVENMPSDPLSPYAVGKLTGELYVKVFAGIYDLPALSLRYFNIFGPRQDPASEYAAVIPRFIISMLEDRAPVIFGDGEQSRDFTFVENAVEANLLAAFSRKAGRGEVVNVACGERYSLNQLVVALNEIMGKNIEPQYSKPRPGDVKHSLADIGRARNLLGYEVKVNFMEGLERTVQWFKNNRSL